MPAGMHDGMKNHSASASTGVGNGGGYQTGNNASANTNFNNTTNPQTHNNQGNPYSGLLADFMMERNAPQLGPDPRDLALLQERGGLLHSSVSPADLAAAAGRVADSNQFGFKNEGLNSDLVQNALSNAQERSDDPLGQRDVLARMNMAANINPTTGMGIMDSIKYNTVDQPDFQEAMNPIKLGVGILGSAVAGPFGGALAGGLMKKYLQKNKNIQMAKDGIKEKITG